jgi:hypothetical protein
VYRPVILKESLAAPNGGSFRGLAKTHAALRDGLPISFRPRLAESPSGRVPGAASAFHHSGNVSFHGCPGGRPTRSSCASSRNLLGRRTLTFLVGIPS